MTRVAILGGTDFIGPPIVDAIRAAGHEAIVVHRGLHEREGQPDVPHRHCDRRDAAALGRALADVDAVVDTCAYSRADAEALLLAAPSPRRLVVLSSMDVYRAWGSLLSNTVTDAVPLDEDAPVRPVRYPFRGRPAPPLHGVDPETYDKLDVEEVMLPAGGVVLRLPIVYGPHDHLRREDLLLRRLRAGRKRIPFGAGNLLFSRGFVREIAAAVSAAVDSPDVRGVALNVCEKRAQTIEHWALRVIEIAGGGAELVRVLERLLPPDLAITGTCRQHLLCDGSRASALLRYRAVDPDAALVETVRWHMAHPPEGSEGPDDLSADDAALAAAGS